MKTINVRTLNASGDSTAVLEMADALNAIIDARYKQGQWPYVGTRIFQFEATSPEDPTILQDAARLRQMLEESPEGITVTLAGDLAGGDLSTDAPVAQKQVTVRTLNQTGDESVTEDIGLAIARVIDARLKNKQWAYVNTNIFQFDEEALNDPVLLVQETSRLHDYVASIDGPVTIMLTGDLAGGSR